MPRKLVLLSLLKMKMIISKKVCSKLNKSFSKTNRAQFFVATHFVHIVVHNRHSNSPFSIKNRHINFPAI
jgi:hypothetical protein